LPPLPVPNKCIWCLREVPQIDFDESHVLPECTGNQQQILPKGIICVGCNNYFGSKIEPALLDDPLFHMRAVLLQLVDPGDMNAFRDRIFDATHQPAKPVNRVMNVHANIKDGGFDFTMEVTYSIQGTHSRTYAERDLARFSRAVHKVAFECLAWGNFVEGVANPIDVFSGTFDPVRRWAREGQPPKPIRPVLRKSASEVPNRFGHEIWTYGADMLVYFNLFGDYYSVVMTGNSADSLNTFRAHIPPGAHDIWMVSDTLLHYK